MSGNGALRPVHGGLSMAWYPHPGFGMVTVTRDGEEPDWWRALSPAEIEDVNLAEIEQHAAADPDHEWMLTVEGPLWGLVAQRRAPGAWVITDALEGFA